MVDMTGSRLCGVIYTSYFRALNLYFILLNVDSFVFEKVLI